jgi:hypothetical protein
MTGRIAVSDRGLPLAGPHAFRVGPNTASEWAKNREDLRPSLPVLLIYIMEQ